MNLLNKYKKDYQNKTSVEMSLEEYLKLCKKDPSAYASPAERLLKALGEPELFNSATDLRFSRIFGNRTIRLYKAFSEIYGLEEVIEKIVSFFIHSAQGLEESKQVLCLRGPVGSAKSTIVEILKKLMESEPIYVLKAGNDLSPVHESPLGLFSKDDAKELELPESLFTFISSPWALKRLQEFEGDVSQFKVVKMFPSKNYQIAITKTEPGDENTQDISVLVGKTDIRKIGKMSQDDPDAYSYSGALCKANRGLLDFVEMLKAPLKTLHPLLTATQEHNYSGTEAIGAIPFDGLIVAHFNEFEWNKFRTDKKNEALLDRFCVIDVPYNLRKTEEIQILQKLIKNSTLKDKPCAPYTYECLAEFTTLTKISPPDNSSLLSKMRVYNGENIKDKDPNAKSLLEYKKNADEEEGFQGVSTREAYKILAEVFNYDPQEIAADPVHLFVVLQRFIEKAGDPGEEQDFLKEVLKNTIEKHYFKQVGNDIQYGYLEFYDEYRQNYFERYIEKADCWLQDNDFQDPDTGQLIDKDQLNKELEIFEKPARITNAKDFRHEVVGWVIRQRAKNKGACPRWDSYAKIKRAIDDSLAKRLDEILPVISFSGQNSDDDKRKHNKFVERMKEKGYTERQLQRIVKWYIDYSKAVA